ncbi:MAG: hypothetical protein OXC48_05765, partial [Endozoicomonadaceae bacterium]|nr:hypothetical protein [Endozoicomonadaceae bacterium]
MNNLLSVLFVFLFQQSYCIVATVSSAKLINIHLISRQPSVYKKTDDYINDQIMSVIKNNKFNATQNNSTIWSNAFNFNKLSATAVDPRTGILTAHFNVGHLLSNFGHGPDINLQVNYNSMSVSNPDGLGYGWSWN